ncbi:MAG: hypothetical protein RLZZ86_190 [Cyanobacteriota bacterium]|jgi:hypothetical protein
MNKSELILFTKATALNQIRKICHPKNRIPSNDISLLEISSAEYKFREIEKIIKGLEKELSTIKRHK